MDKASTITASNTLALTLRKAPDGNDCGMSRRQPREIRPNGVGDVEEKRALAVAGGQSDQGSNRRRPCECGGIGASGQP